jgi:thiol-disulfide isomerase/thioredoxin
MMTHGLRASLVTACIAAFCSQGIAAPKRPIIDVAAPDFQVTTVDGRTLSLADFKGQVLVINFWATWCAPCKRELPMSKLKSLSAALAIPMVREFKGAYGPLKGVPTNYVIGRDGVLRYAKAGALTVDKMNAILVPLLRAQVSAP